MTKDKPPEKLTPPKAAVKSVQYDLFSQFITNDPDAVSNTVEIWESIPKYFLSPLQQKKLRTSEGLAKPYEREYIYNNKACMVTIQPALIKQKDGDFKAFFPSVTEELVEEALKKILANQNYGIHDPAKSETWVHWSSRNLLLQWSQPRAG